MTRLVSAVLATALLIGSCAGGQAVTGDRRNVGVVTVVFSARPARVRVGQAVRMSIRLVNNSGRPSEVQFDQGRLYDFWAVLDDEEVWRWSDGREFDAADVNVTLASQQPQTYSETWTPDATGTYQVFGVVESDGFDRPLSGRVTVE